MSRSVNNLRVAFLTLPAILLLAPRIFAADRGPINSGETRVGLDIPAPPYLDTWTFEGNVGDRIIITAVTTSGSLDTTIYLYPPDGGPAEATSRYRYNSRDYGGDILDWQLKKSGLYTIVIQDCYLNNSGIYNITFLKIPGAVSSTEDPDGGPIASGETLSGTSNVASDLDGFQFYGDVNDRVIITAVTTSGSLDTTIYLYPPDGGPAEATSRYRYNSRDYGGDILDWQLKKSGLYTIVIQDCYLNNSGNYNITFLKIPGAISSPEDRDGGAIASGETLSGTINVASDLDAFQFYGDANDRVIITAVTTSGSLDTTIYLYPPGGGPAEATSRYRYNSRDYGGDILDWQLKKSGLYTIVIQDCYLNSSGSYNISLSKIPPPARGLYDPCPSNGGLIGACCSAELRWQPVTGAMGYDVYFGTDVIDPLSKIADNHSAPSLPMPQLQDDQVYYWYVVAHTATNDIIGPWWWFATYAADFDQNGIVNFLDFAILASHWEQNEPLVDIAPSGGDGIIDFLDLERLSDEWLYTEPCY